MPLSDLDRAVLASAYELAQAGVDEDASQVQHWQGTDAGLLLWLEQRHGWTPASEYARYYLAALRTALDASA